LRSSKVRLQPDGGKEITAIRDAGVRDLFDKEREFRRATIFPAGEDDIGFPARARICAFFEDAFGIRMDREDAAIADAVAQRFPQIVQQIRSVEAKLNRLPGSPAEPAAFVQLGGAIEQCIRSCRETRPTVALVKKHLDTLRDGVPLVKMFDAELTPDAIRAVSDAQSTMIYQVSQLEALDVESTNVTAAASRVKAHLESERPWREIRQVAEDLHEIRAAYVAERRSLLQWQEREAEAVRMRVKGREGFSTLTADQAHHVLRPLEQASSETDANAIAPPLVDLRDPFQVHLRRAEDAANEKLDAILSEGTRSLITSIDLALRNRELSTEADVDALLNEIRSRLIDQIRAGSRVRLT